MKFDKILEYQKIDQDIIALEETVNNSEERRNYVIMKKRLTDSSDLIKKLTEEANALMGSFASLQKELDELKGKLDEYDGVVEDVQDIVEAEYHLKGVNAICSDIAKLEKELTQSSKKLDEINEKYKATWDKGIKENAACGAAKTKYLELVAKYKPEFDQLSAQRDALKGEIDPKFIDIYNVLRNSKKMPAFVPYDKKMPGCPRCGMSLENATLSELNAPGDYVECPNCRRILFIPEN